MLLKLKLLSYIHIFWDFFFNEMPSLSIRKDRRATPAVYWQYKEKEKKEKKEEKKLSFFFLIKQNPFEKKFPIKI